MENFLQKALYKSEKPWYNVSVIRNLGAYKRGQISKPPNERDGIAMETYIDRIKQILEENKNELFLPFYMSLEREYNNLERIFKNLITQHLKDTAAGKMQVLSLWCEIVSRIDEAFRKQIMGNENENTGEYYSRKVKKYIETHYQEELNLNILSQMLNITPNYLSRIFKRETGKSITEFVARTRLSYARDLVYEGRFTYDEIAHRVGICNGKYMNKMFKKYYGISVHKCRLTDNEISLYHDKPWEVKYLTKDIYDNS